MAAKQNCSKAVNSILTLQQIFLILFSYSYSHLISDFHMPAYCTGLNRVSFIPVFFSMICASLASVWTANDKKHQ